VAMPWPQACIPPGGGPDRTAASMTSTPRSVCRDILLRLIAKTLSQRAPVYSGTRVQRLHRPLPDQGITGPPSLALR
jgi:hypothetical protein